MVQATGNIRNYEIIIGSFTLLILPITYFLFKFGAAAYYYLIVLISIYAVSHFFRLLIAKQQLGLSIGYYFSSVFLPVVLSTIPSLAIAYYICSLFFNNLMGLFFSVVFCFLISTFFIFLLGLEKAERLIITTQVRERLIRN
jgi:hypothetical protein